MLDTIYFFINGSSSPFWEKEKIINGNIFYDNLCWPDEISASLKQEWINLRILYDTHRNPIDIRFPSFWSSSMCGVFNNIAYSFLEKCKLELVNYNIIDKFEPINEHDNLWEYRFDPIKYHLNQNKNFNDKTEFIEFLRNHEEKKSNFLSELSYYKKFQISYQEFKAFFRTFLHFGNYNHFSIEFCPFSNRTFLAIPFEAGHDLIYLAMRIKRIDILENENKLIGLVQNYFR
jgi:hypothetical protein